MKKIKLILAGAEEDWAEQSSGDGGLKWDFEANPELVCIIMEKVDMPNKFKVGTKCLLVKVINAATKERYAFFCKTVLEGKMRPIPVFSKVKIVNKGKPAGKTYYDYAVMFDRKFQYNPAEWEQNTSEFVESSVTTEAALNAANPTAQNSTGGSQVYDDIPF